MATTHGTFTMTLDSTKKVMIAFAEGLFDMDQGNAFCKAFMESARKASAYKDYSLIIDVKGVRPTSPEVQQALGQAMALYASKDFTFKKRFMTKLASAITQSQVVRLSKNVPGFSDCVTFVDTKEEALSKI
ncbi:MAG TPA: hypothetical protein PKA28_06740 [Methylomusa anaerophila]|uniref:STAS/SEC14 domain-containing protein n=1 Tax=Methylomusa anaerophila TaxID=1930071 RepID=A0A348AGE5_9FIRM|nr:hypothetical protein [Methylomusa anaerophila]BBB90143.1 hypothetical protein MAMMFC1_00791 [Methylomusa anaerophila]HML88133.1 hypothetical protein [Methylomusa anaerophila]